MLNKQKTIFCLFNHLLLELVQVITGISFRNIHQFMSINWNTIYRYFIKLQKYKSIKILVITNNFNVSLIINTYESNINEIPI